jgi:TPR repeat protein
MRKLLLSSAFIFALVAAGPAAAGPLQAGIAAYNAHDYQAAARLLLPLAQHGNPMAQTYVGFMFANGRGLPLNYVAAADWYRAASEQGVPVAQFQLGLMYDKGLGLPQDYVLAYKWLNVATARATPREREYWVKIRDAVGTKLSLIDRTAGQDLASKWYYVRRPPEVR